MPAIEMEDLWFKYDSEWIIRGINKSINEGAVIGLLGKSGSGKTTLLKILAGARKPNRGRVSILGVNPRNARGLLAYVPQNPSHAFYMPTVLEEVMDSLIGMKGLSRLDAEKAARDVLSIFGLGEYASENPFNLSWGEQRRLSLAVIAAYGPRVVLLDEPSTGLSYRDRKWVAALLRGLRSTMVVATHDVDFLLQLGVNDIVEINNGILAPISCRDLVARSELSMILNEVEIMGEIESCSIDVVLRRFRHVSYN